MRFPKLLPMLLLILLGSCKTDPKPETEVANPVWSTVYRHDSILWFSLGFSDAENGLISGARLDHEGYLRGNILMKTSNSGQSWEEVPTADFPVFTDIVFLDKNVGLATAQSRIYRTLDGGTNWVKVYENSTISPEAIAFADQSNGLVTGLFGVVLKTTDGGLHWNLQPSGYHCHLGDVDMTDSNTAYATGYMNQTDHLYGAILITHDGGISWDSIPTGQLMCSSLSFPSKNAGYVFGATLSGSMLLRTSDAGISWETSIQSSFAGTAATSFIDAPRGFSVGQNGRIIRTIDYGQNWESMQSNTNASLGRIQMIDINNGYAIGIDDGSMKGVVLRYR